MKLLVMVTALLSFASSAFAQQHEHGAQPAEKIGTVAFANSCNAAAQQPFGRAVALLHSFEFSRAIAGFEETVKADAACGIAYWGIAVARWTNPFATGIRPTAQLKLGWDAVQRARAIGLHSEREQAYVTAVSQLYADAEKRDQRSRVLAYRDAMANLANRYPGDTEASIFYALALTVAEEPTDKTYASRRQAGAMLEKLWAVQPDHPGLAHYIIHSYDVPALAGKALDAARRYATIAPSAPHALHMPSHTFTRVGSWQESIDTNIASGEAARRDGATAEELHALDYRMYAYLQIAQDESARRVRDDLPAIAARFDPTVARGSAPGSAGVFALAAIPARYALERRAWSEAAALEPHSSAYPYAEAMTYFARAIGAAHQKNVTSARAAIDALQRIRDDLAKAGETYWAEQVEIERRGAAAWLALAEGRTEEALGEMRTAADREDATEKAAVTPGPLVPARELLGDMLLDLNRPAEALRAYEETLTKEPNRFRTVYGAAHAAAKAGNKETASRYYRQLLTICARADTNRPELVEARTAVQ